MEGNFSSGCVLLPEYLRVADALKSVQETCEYPEVVDMINTMLILHAKYQTEAADSEAVLLATILNPRYRLKFLELHYLMHSDSAKEAIEKVFEETLAAWPVTPPPSPKSPLHPVPSEVDAYDVFGSSGSTHVDSAALTRQGELKAYLDGTHPIKVTQGPLDWWKVSCLSFFCFFICKTCAD